MTPALQGPWTPLHLPGAAWFIVRHGQGSWIGRRQFLRHDARSGAVTFLSEGSAQARADQLNRRDCGGNPRRKA